MPSPFTANLKHLYQRRALWFWYAFIGFAFGFPMVTFALFTEPRAGTGRFCFFLAVSAAAGLLAASLQKEILSRPFSHVLPRHWTIPRPFILLVGVVLNALLGLLFLNYPGLTLGQALLAAASAAAFGMSTYLLAALLTLSHPRLALFFGFLFIPLYAAVFFDIHVALEHCIVSLPFVGILLCALALTLGWSRLADTRTFRESCGEVHVSILDSWNWQRAKEIQRRVAAEKLAKSDRNRDLPPSNRLADLIRKHVPAGTPMHVCSALYEALGHFSLKTALAFSLWILLWLIALAYIPFRQTSMTSFVFLCTHIAGVHMRFPATFRLFLPLGRHERFLASLAVVACVTAFFTAAAVLLVACFHALDPVMPDIVLKGLPFTFRAPGIRSIVLIPVVVPLGFLIQLFLPDNLLKMLPFMAFMILWQLTVFKLLTLAPALTALIVLATWIAFPLLLHHHCTRRSLLRRP